MEEGRCKVAVVDQKMTQDAAMSFSSEAKDGDSRSRHGALVWLHKWFADIQDKSIVGAAALKHNRPRQNHMK